MILNVGFVTFSIIISVKHFFAEDLGMNADPNHPHQRKELPSSLGLTHLVSGGIHNTSLAI